MTIKNIIIVSLLFALVACNHIDRKAIDPEIAGKWTDSKGCNLELAFTDLTRHELKLIDFTSSKTKLDNKLLKYSKNGVLKNFATEGFDASFVDGFIIINTNECKGALHKQSVE